MYTLPEWGEPTWNENVLAFGLALKGIAKSAGLVAKTIHPVVSTMLPKANSKLGNFRYRKRTPNNWIY